MKLKGLMLGVAAAATATTAQAADLPVAPEPVDYVRVCDAYGSRFYYIPGTETCLRVGGRLRTQFVVNNVLDNDDFDTTSGWQNRDADGYSWLTRGYAYLDARNATEFGTLRAYVGLRMDITNGNSGFKLDAGYIQWGGLTAGYLGSNFNIYTGQVFMGVVTRDWSDSTVNQIAYTAAFGNGFSATLALEDRSGREVGAYGGTRMPDVVAALSVSQGWGSAQISGALHQVYPDAAFNSTNASGDEDSLGWAIGAGVNVGTVDEPVLRYPVLAPVLVIVGAMMAGALAGIDWKDPVESLPAFLCLVVMPLSVSITEGVAWGVMARSLLGLTARRPTPFALHALAAFFLARAVFLD